MLRMDGRDWNRFSDEKHDKAKRLYAIDAGPDGR
jgi:hypothetical protein